MSACYRDALAEMAGHFKDGAPEIALLTTFNFSPAFFERNVLPLLAGFTDDEPPATDVLLNERLQKTAVLVAYDQSTQPEPKGDFRYGLLPTGLKDGFFHPKLIVLAGSLKDGSAGIWLSVSSGNLTLSGWGRNREVVGTTRVGRQQAGELLRLTKWLKEQAQRTGRTSGEGAPLDTLTRLHDRLQEVFQHSEPDDVAELFIQLPDSAGLAARLFAPDSGEVEEMTVVSPFWSGLDDLERLLSLVNPKRVHLVPAIDREGHYRFPQEGRRSKLENARFFCFQKDRERYTHAKAIELVSAKDRTTLCIGSANFTTAAFGLDGSPRRNIEAMLRYVVDSEQRPISDQLEQLKAPKFSDDAAEEGEEAPATLPFLVEAHYDWRTQRFHCRLHAYDGDTLPTGKSYQVAFADETETLSTDKPVARIDKSLKTPRRMCTLREIDDHGQGTEFQIPVDQRNAREDQLGYRPRPRLDSLIEQLLWKDPADIGKGRRSDRSSRSAAEAIHDEETNTSFDLFTPLQALYKLRQALAQSTSGESPFSSGGWLDGLVSALEIEQDAKTWPQIQLAIHHYVLLWELCSIAEAFATHEDYPDFRERLDRLIEAAEPCLHEQLCLEKGSFQRFLGTPDKLDQAADKFLEWFRKEMMAQPRPGGCSR